MSSKPASRTISLAVRGLLFSISVFILNACVTHTTIEDVSLSYATIRKIVASQIPGGVVRQTENAREIYSAYFTPETGRPDALHKPVRAYVAVTILGESRPYMVDIHVYREEADGQTGTYFEPVEDEKLTDKMSKRIRDALADRREERNVIDDFRAF